MNFNLLPKSNENELGLRRRFREQLGRISDELISETVNTEENSVSAHNTKRIAALKDMAWLCDVQDAERQRSTRSKWPLIVALVMLLSIASLLIFWRTPTTDIEIEATTRSVAYTLIEASGILNTLQLSEIGLGGISSFSIPKSETGNENAGISPGSNGRARLILSNPKAGRLTLNALTAPANTLVSLQVSNVPGQLLLVLTPPVGTELALDLSLNGQIVVTIHSSDIDIHEIRAFATTRNASFRSSGSLSLDVTPLSKKGFALPGALRFRGLSFVYEDPYVIGPEVITREISGLTSGILYLESLNGKAIKLRPAEELRFGSFEGVLRTIALEDGRLKLSADEDGEGFRTEPIAQTLRINAQAVVTDMTIGAGRNRRSLVPTVLEWLAARQSLALLWAVILSAAGIVVAILKWIGIEG